MYKFAIAWNAARINTLCDQSPIRHRASLEKLPTAAYDLCLRV